MGDGVPIKWLAKAIIQKAVSFTPDPDGWNHRLQKVFGREVLDRGTVVNRADMAARHLEAFELAGLSHGPTGFDRPVTILEVGTGWHPIVPILFFLLGAERIVSVDHVDHSSLDKLTMTVTEVADALAAGALDEFLPNRLESREAELRRLADAMGSMSEAEILAALRIERAVGDAREIRIDGSIDAVVSNHVLEHVPADLLGPILSACFEMCVDGGVMSHTADLIDHGHYVDHRLSQFNYLRFTPRQWKLVGNDIQHENRLRLADYRRIYAEAGVPIDWESTRNADPEHLARIPVAEPFRSMDPMELQVQFAHFMSKRGVPS